MALTISAVGLGAAAVAQETRIDSGWITTDFSRVRMIAASDAIGEDGKARLGFHAVFDEGWHFYWRSAADTGFPPKFDWSRSVNVDSVKIDWPAPKRYNLLGFDSYAYTNEVVLPITVTARDPRKPVSVRADVFFAICADVCTFHEETFAIDLPAGAARPTEYAEVIERFGAAVPLRQGGGMEIEEAAVRNRNGERVLEVVARSTRPFAQPDLIIEGPIEFYFSRPAMTLESKGHVARFTIPVAFEGEGSDPGLQGNAVTLTLLDDARAIERERVLAAR